MSLSRWFWIESIHSISTLVGMAAMVILALAFWKLHLLAPTRTSRTGVVASLINLGIWLIYGVTWSLSMLPAPFALWTFRIYEIPYLWGILWMGSALALTSSLLALAWALHRGITPPAGPPADPAA